MAEVAAGGSGADPVSEAFRQFMSSYFTGVTVVTSIDRSGRPHGLTCNSLTSVTLCPPTLLVCLDVRSGTLAAVRGGAGFAVNLLHAGARHAAEVFASRAPDRFEQVAWRRAARSGEPCLTEDAYAVAECRVVDTLPVGDHVVVLGRVVTVRSDPEAPLLYGMRAFSGRDRTPAT
jgi:flavin reductase (NADH)